MKTDKEQAYADGCEDGRLFAYTTIEQLQELTGKQIKEIGRLRKIIEGEIGRLKYFVDTESIKAQQRLLKALKES